MSLYNMLFGQNPLSRVILATLNLTPADTGRFRDCFVSEGKIAVYTRNGGGNREDYMPDFSDHPCYLSDEDDDYDCTYATIYFKFPERYAEILTAIDTGKFEPDKRWLDYLKNMKKPDYVIPEPMIQLMGKLRESLESGKSGVVEV